jgi:hypothetical protein
VASDFDNRVGQRDNEQRMLGVLVEECPNGTAQAAASTHYNEMLRAGESHKSIMQSLAGALYDGLAYGNWPTTGEVS